MQNRKIIAFVILILLLGMSLKGIPTGPKTVKSTILTIKTLKKYNDTQLYSYTLKIQFKK